MNRDSKMLRFAVVPAYEPDEKLINVASQAVAAGFQVIVVDDGSETGRSVKNGTAKAEDYHVIFENAKFFAHVIRYRENKGKGHAMKTAFSYITENYEDEEYTVVVIDSDGQHKVSDAIRLTDYAVAHPDTLVLGSRRQSGDSPLRSRIGNGITRNVFRAVSGLNIYDTQTGMRAFSKELMKKALSVSGDRYEYEMNMLMDFSRDHVSIAELPIETIYIDNNSGSHFHPFKDSARIYGEIFKFSASSFFSFLIDYLVFVCIVALFGPSVSIVLFANVFARVVSAVSNYSINRNFVFRAADLDNDHKNKKTDDDRRASAIKYSALAVSILLVNSTLLYGLTTYTDADPAVLKVLVEILMFFVSYTVQRKFVFVGGTRGKKNRKEQVPADVEILAEDSFPAAKDLNVAVK